LYVFSGQGGVGMYSSSEANTSSESGESDDEEDVHWMATQIEREICVEDDAVADNVDTVSFLSGFKFLTLKKIYTSFIRTTVGINI
jgi:hypothetical protein